MMFFNREPRLQVIERKIAGKKARLAVIMEIKAWAGNLQGALVSEMLDLSEEIAALELQAKQLSQAQKQ